MSDSLCRTCDSILRSEVAGIAVDASSRRNGDPCAHSLNAPRCRLSERSL